MIQLSGKSIAVVTGSESTKNRIVMQLEKLLEGHAVIKGYALDAQQRESIVADLVVYTSRSILLECQPELGEEQPHILARRAIDSAHLDQLFVLKRGTHALLVNDSKESTDESIELLNLLGFNNVTWVPFYPELSAIEKQKGIEQCHMAVTLGEKEFVPEEMLHVVDLGPRIIDLSTIVEILHHLDLLDEKSHYLSATYFATVVKMGKTIHKAMADQEKLNDKLSQVLHQINDGLLAYDKNGMIRVFSQRCELIFGLRAERVIGKSIAQAIKSDKMLQFLKEPGEVMETIIRIDSESYAVQKFSSGVEDWIVCTLKNLNEMAVLESKRRQQLIQKGHVAKYGFEDIVYSSKVMAEAIFNAKRIAKTHLAILIFGESGTGKELFASAMHRESLVSDGPFLAVNFSALPEELVESELFGYEEGAFTGAKKGGKIGLFEQANGGTLFLDEIGDISLKIQARLLRVLQEKEIMRVGGHEIIPVNVRIIAATNKPLMTMCDKGQFREDLYYRLKRLYLKTPPLRERREDIPALVAYFLQKNDWQNRTVDPLLMESLIQGAWKGNVRELESVVEYLVAVSDDLILSKEELPKDMVYEPLQSNYEFYGDLNRGINGEKIGGNGEKLGNSYHGLSPDLIELLGWIQELEGKGDSIGREKLSARSQESLMPLSEDQIRTRIKKLEAIGMISVYKGRRGIELTALGREFNCH